MVITGMSIPYPKVRLQNEGRHLSFHCLDEIPPNAPLPFLSLCSGNINGCRYLKIFFHSTLSLEMDSGTWISPRKWWRCTYPKSAGHSLCISLCTHELLMENGLRTWSASQFSSLTVFVVLRDLREKGTSQSQRMATSCSCSWRAPFQADLHCLQVQAIRLPSTRIAGSIMEGINDKLTMTCLKTTPSKTFVNNRETLLACRDR